MTVHIIYYNFLDETQKKISVGGTQTYISALIPVFQNQGIACRVYQNSDHEFETQYNGATVVAIKKEASIKKNKIALYKRAISSFVNGDLLLYGCHDMIFKKANVPTWAIQHGISWDIPVHTDYSREKNYLYSISKFIREMRIVRQIDLVDKVICVDHNFVCWYRTMLAYPNTQLKVIPNFAPIAPVSKKSDDTVNIIFARRFFSYRGTRVFGEAIKRILREYENVRVTIAGSGPDQKYFDDAFSNNPNVEITSYVAADSLRIHADKHIAVIPTTGSEGTSLSLLEAMSAQCAVVCTNVGGMTNIILNDYNGLMIAPESNELYLAMKKLIDDAQLRNYLADHAYETVKQAFSIEKWEESWKAEIRDFLIQ